MFQWELENLRPLAENYSNPTVEWAIGTGETDGEIVFSASTIALLNFLIPRASATEIRSRVNDVCSPAACWLGCFKGRFTRSLPFQPTERRYCGPDLKSRNRTLPSHIIAGSARIADSFSEPTSPAWHAKLKPKPNGGANLGFEQKLWQMADKLRGHMDASECKHVVLGLIFLKYISDSFQERYEDLKKEPHADPEDRDEYTAEHIFWVPKRTLALPSGQRQTSHYRQAD